LKPLVNKKYLLEKFPGKGGWTFARIPEVLQDKHAYFGWVKVKGSVDGISFNKYHLMPMGNGSLFLPVKADIRKKIKKEAGDYVHVILYPDNEPLEIPAEMIQCIEDEPKALKFFNTLSEQEQKNYMQWIYAAKKEETRIARMAMMIDRLSKRMKCIQGIESE
jgi:hypothetical protein